MNDVGNIATAGHCVDPVSWREDILSAATVWAYETDWYDQCPECTPEDIRGFVEDHRIEGEKKGASGGYTRGADIAVQAVWDTESTQPLYDSQGNLNGEPHEARTVRYIPWDNGEGDVAILKVEGVTTIGLPVLNEAVETGTEIISVGYPAAVGEVSDSPLSDPSFRPGAVASVRTNGVYPVYEMSTTTSGGMSGGPTVLPDGTVVGVVSFGHIEEQAFNFSQSSQTLSQLMSDIAVSNDLGEVGTAYRAGLDALYAGDKATAVEQLTLAVDSADEEFPFAEDALDDAEALPDPAAPDGEEAAAEGGSSALPLVIAAAVIVAVIAVVLLVLRSRKGPAPARASSASTSPGPSPDGPTPPPPVAGAPAFCSSCGAALSEDAAFCPKCGTPTGKQRV